MEEKEEWAYNAGFANYADAIECVEGLSKYTSEAGDSTTNWIVDDDICIAVKENENGELIDNNGNVYSTWDKAVVGYIFFTQDSETCYNEIKVRCWNTGENDERDFVLRHEIYD